MNFANTSKRSSGFSILELIVAMALGLVLLGAATQLFTTGMKTTALVSNRTEMQQNVRAALDLIAKDVSMAGAGLPPGGLQLPANAGSTATNFGCDQTGLCYVTAHAYPTGTVGSAANPPATPISNYMFGIIPGPGNGLQLPQTTIAATGRTPDSITVVYVDYGFPLQQFTGALNATGTTLTLNPPVPQPVTTPDATDAGVGIKIGDLLLVTTSKGTEVGEVSAVSPLAIHGATVTFTNADPLNFNQTGAASNNMTSIVPPAVPAPTVTARRLLAITYFIQIPASTGTPRLMRQVNGNLPQPVADNIIDMQFSYDLCDPTTGGATCAATRNPLGGNYSPNQIHKVNFQIMGQSLLSNGKDWQNMQLSTAVSARNLTYKDRYQ
jgi:type II secretory pathway pseudopilin PulG